MSLTIRKVKMKTTMKYQYIPSKMAKIMKLENTKCWQDNNVEHKLSLQLIGMYIVTTTLPNKFGIIYLRWNHVCPMTQQLDRLLGTYLAEKCAPKEETQWVCSNNTIVNSSEPETKFIKNRMNKHIVA